MDSPSKFESLTVRFAPYVGDLHEFFTSCGMPFGAPQDLVPFAAALAVAGTFHEDMSSLVRSIIYRENKAITILELLELLVVAAGGPQVDHAAEEVNDSVRQILVFSREVYRSLGKVPSSARSVPDALGQRIATMIAATAIEPAAETERPVHTVWTDDVPQAAPNVFSLPVAEPQLPDPFLEETVGAAVTEPTHPFFEETVEALATEPRHPSLGEAVEAPETDRPQTSFEETVEASETELRHFSVEAPETDLPHPFFEETVETAPRLSRLEPESPLTPVATRRGGSRLQAILAEPEPELEEVPVIEFVPPESSDEFVVPEPIEMSVAPEPIEAFVPAPTPAAIDSVITHRAHPVAAPSNAYSRPVPGQRWVWLAALCSFALVALAATLLLHRSRPTALAGQPGPALHARSAGVVRSPNPSNVPSSLPVPDASQTASTAPDATDAAPVAANTTDDAQGSSSGTEISELPHVESNRSRQIRPLMHTEEQQNSAGQRAPRSAGQTGGQESAFARPEPFPKAIYPVTAEAGTSSPNHSYRPERLDHTERPERLARSSPNVRQGLFSVSSGIMAGNLLSATPPEYPKLAKMTHTEGEVVLQAFVARDGSVIATHVLRGHRLLRGAAEHAVRRWRYRPYTIEGRAIDVATVVTVVFHLHP